MSNAIAQSFLDLHALRLAEVSEDPFAHVTIRNFVPDTVLQSVVAGLPRLKSGGSFPIASLRLGADAQKLIDELEGARFRNAIAHKFNLDLAEAPTMITLRGWCREKDGRIHCDSTTKLVTALLYLNPESESWKRQEGCLRLLRSANDIEDFTEEVPPVNGTLLVFPNTATAWHGHKPFVGPRHVVQLNYMTNDAKARQELRRHRFSAFLKKFTPAR